MKCAIYTRVSTDSQAEVEFNSCEAQEEKIKSFIKSQEDMEIFKVYSDLGFTGANLNRPALSNMLYDIKQNKINLIISYKIDRLTRSPKDFYQLIELFEKHGIDFISVTERFDTSTPSGRLLRNIMLTFAQFERELSSERTKDKMIQRAQKGMWNGGAIPFGYNGENKRLVIDEKEAEVVRNIYEIYISTGSLSNIHSVIDKPPKSRIFNILRNITYTGKINYAGKIYAGVHKPIISEDMFNMAQEIHQNKKRKLRLYKNYPLAGLIKCKECHSSMTPCHTNKRKNERLKRYYYYRCSKTFKADWDSCNTRQVSSNKLESYIFQNLERISLDKQYLESLVFKLNNSALDNRTGLEPVFESPKISPEILGQTLKIFVEGLSERRGRPSRQAGIERNIWAKKFIKNILYSKDNIVVSFFYFDNCDKKDLEEKPSGRVGAATGFFNPLLKSKRENHSYLGETFPFLELSFLTHS